MFAKIKSIFFNQIHICCKNYLTYFNYNFYNKLLTYLNIKNSSVIHLTYEFHYFLNYFFGLLL
jgi:hypothetical protein